MLTEGAKTPPGTQRLVDKSHRSCGAHRWQRPADAATALTTNTRGGEPDEVPRSRFWPRNPRPLRTNSAIGLPPRRGESWGGDRGMPKKNWLLDICQLHLSLACFAIDGPEYPIYMSHAFA